MVRTFPPAYPDITDLSLHVFKAENHFSVEGLPATKGSMRSFRHFKTGKIVMLPACKGLRGWEAKVRAAVGHRKPTAGPRALKLIFKLARPKSHFKKYGVLKASAPTHPIAKNRNDIDKLIRACLDAMTGFVYHDDSQVVDIQASKWYCNPGEVNGVEILFA